MKYYLGPFVQSTLSGMPCFAPPVGALGCIDLAPIPVQSQIADHRPIGVFWTSGALLPSEYTLVGDGDCRELATTGAMQDAFQSLVGYRPQGDRLVNLAMDCLQGGSDPSGQNGPLPIVPTVDGWMDLWMPGHSRVLSERFEWGKPGSRGSNHTPKLKALLRLEFAKLFADAQSGRLKDNQHHRRVLDAWCDKYNLQGTNDWKEFVPDNLQKDVPGRLKHETTISDDFNRADGTTIGDQLTWTEVQRDWSTVSNQALNNSGTNGGFARAESDLSSADHYSQNLCAVAPSVNNTGPLTRFAIGANTNYLYTRDGRIFKVVSGGLTSIATGGSAAAVGDTMKLTSNGSSHQGFKNGVSSIGPVTDTSITGNLRCGIYSDNGYGVDNFQAADLSAAGILYTQLERGTRGLVRGSYGGSL